MTGRLPGRRGRLRATASLHVSVMRELGAAMRQIRVAVGFEDLEAAREILNSAVRELYPDIGGRGTTHRGQKSSPHLLTAKYLSGIERGNVSNRRVPPWLADSEYAAGQVRSSAIPHWLVRCYDHAFLADGYLIDMSYWAQQAAREHDSDLPTRAERAPNRLTSAAESTLITRDFPNASSDVVETLHGHVQELAERRASYACDELSWVPQEGDASASLGEGEE